MCATSTDSLTINSIGILCAFCCLLICMILERCFRVNTSIAANTCQDAYELHVGSTIPELNSRWLVTVANKHPNAFHGTHATISIRHPLVVTVLNLNPITKKLNNDLCFLIVCCAAIVLHFRRRIANNRFWTDLLPSYSYHTLPYADRVIINSIWLFLFMILCSWKTSGKGKAILLPTSCPRIRPRDYLSHLSSNMATLRIVNLYSQPLFCVSHMTCLPRKSITDTEESAIDPLCALSNTLVMYPNNVMYHNNVWAEHPPNY